jgi:ADP-heptose:LPS heptosyltransferase
MTGSRTSKPWACISRCGGVGDNLMATSVLPLLADKYNVEVITQTPQSVVFENNPYISKLTTRKRGDLPPGGLEWQKWYADRATEYELLVNLSHSCETTLALVTAQTQFYWPHEWRKQNCGKNYLEWVHDIVGVPHVFAPGFFPTDEEWDKAEEVKRQVGGRYIAWVVSGTRLDKIYPQATMAVARLIKETGLPVVLMGAPGKDNEMTRIIQKHVTKQNGTDAGCHSAVSVDEAASTPELRKKLGLKPGVENWPIRRVLTQARMADLVIGPDTGVLWAVAMDDMPKIVKLSHASPENITKHWKNTVTLHADPAKVPCWPCHRLHDEHSTCTPNAENNGAACISDISVETIVTTALKLLQGVETWPAYLHGLKATCLTGASAGMARLPNPLLPRTA